MLDGYTYRMSEKLAERHILSWHLAQNHEVIFDHNSFPKNTNSLSELAQLLDSMQENRFEQYMREMNGLTENDLDLFVDILCDIVIFQLTFMPDLKPKIPYSTAISNLLGCDLASDNPGLTSQ